MVAVLERPVEAEDTPIVERGLRVAAPPALANSARWVDGPAVLLTTATRLAMVLLLLWLWGACREGVLRKQGANDDDLEIMPRQTERNVRPLFVPLCLCPLTPLLSNTVQSRQNTGSSLPGQRQHQLGHAAPQCQEEAVQKATTIVSIFILRSSLPLLLPLHPPRPGPTPPPPPLRLLLPAK